MTSTLHLFARLEPKVEHLEAVRSAILDIIADSDEGARGLVAWRRVGTESALWLRDYARRMNCA